MQDSPSDNCTAKSTVVAERENPLWLKSRDREFRETVPSTDVEGSSALLTVFWFSAQVLV